MKKTPGEFEEPEGCRGKKKAAAKNTMPTVEKKKRGRKAKDDYLELAEAELKNLKADYNGKKKDMAVKDRAKARNRISALESHIKKRLS